jgi:hypothetical protein
MAKFALATGYPVDNALIRSEMNKILDDPKRKENIKKAEIFFSRYVKPRKRVAKFKKK